MYQKLSGKFKYYINKFKRIEPVLEKKDDTSDHISNEIQTSQSSIAYLATQSFNLHSPQLIFDDYEDDSLEIKARSRSYTIPQVSSCSKRASCIGALINRTSSQRIYNSCDIVPALRQGPTRFFHKNKTTTAIVYIANDITQCSSQDVDEFQTNAEIYTETLSRVNYNCKMCRLYCTRTKTRDALFYAYITILDVPKGGVLIANIQTGVIDFFWIRTPQHHRIWYCNRLYIPTYIKTSNIKITRLSNSELILKASISDSVSHIIESCSRII